MRHLELKDREDRLADLAERQWGLLFTADLRRAGLDASAIARRVRQRRLARLYAGVFAFGHTQLLPQARWWAALTTCGKATALSHVTAGRFHGWPLDDVEDDRIHLSTTRAIQSRADIVVHRTRHLDRVDLFHTRPFRVTTIPRTLVDLADVLEWDTFRALADSRPRLDVRAIARAQARCPKRPGSPLVTRLIEADDAHTKSEFERRFLRFVTAHDFPRPDLLNEWVAGHKADCVYRFRDGRSPRGLVVELDGRAYHERRAQMRADRHRDTDYQLAGYLILRLVWDDLHPSEVPRTARRLRRLLDA